MGNMRQWITLGNSSLTMLPHARTTPFTPILLALMSTCVKFSHSHYYQSCSPTHTKQTFASRLTVPLPICMHSPSLEKFIYKKKQLLVVYVQPYWLRSYSLDEIMASGLSTSQIFMAAWPCHLIMMDAQHSKIITITKKEQTCLL